MKKAVWLLAAAVILSLALAGGAAAEEIPVRVYRPAGSSITMEVYETLEEKTVPEKSAANGMVAYLTDDDTGLLLEIYRYSMQDGPWSLADFVEQDAARYGGTGVVTDGDINGLNAGWYDLADPESDFRITYLFLEEETGCLVIGYVMNTDEAVDELKQILDSLSEAA